MRTGIQLILMAGMLATVTIAVHPHSLLARAAEAAVQCNCGQSDCRSCCTGRGNRCRPKCRKCPKCENDLCQLHAECVNEQRLGFEVEQRIVCIPEISLPWRKCQQPCNGDCCSRCRKLCGKSKVVKVLIPRVYECPTCKYSWRVFEPELPTGTTGEDAAAGTTDETDSVIEQPEFEQDRLYDPEGSDVPAAPPTTRIDR